MVAALNDLPDIADVFTKCGARTERKRVEGGKISRKISWKP